MQAAAPRSERILVPMVFRTGLYRLASWVNRRKAVIVMYHGFTAAASHPGIENHEQKHVHIAAFERHLAFLETHHRVVPLEVIVRAFTEGKPLPERAAAITIDDGYRSTYTIAYPALARLQLPASLFVTTDFVDNRRFLWTDRVEYAVNHARVETLEVPVAGETRRFDLTSTAGKMTADRRLRGLLKSLDQESRDAGVDAIERAAGCSVCSAGDAAAIYEPCRWDEVSEMAGSGLVSIGSHTHTHVILSRCAPSRAAEELRVSREILESRLGAPCPLFCYPNGRRGDFNATTTALLKEHGFTSALTTVYGNNGAGADVYALKRYNLGKPMMPGEVDVRLSGIMEMGGSIRRAMPQARTRRC